MNPTNLVVATTTVAEKQQAAAIAKLVIESKVAACAQIDGPIESHYCWENQISQELEWRLTMKTTFSNLPKLQELVHGSHPYEQPQWVVFEVSGSTVGYENWVRESVLPDMAENE